MRVLVTPDYRALSRLAAELVAQAIVLKPNLTLGLPTGHTPEGMYEELVSWHRDGGASFAGVRTFNLDEYLGLPEDHPRSYHTYMRTHLFDHVDIPRNHIDIPNGAPGVDAGPECDRYESSIRAAGGIDLLIVGVGTNGHIAFNEPGSSFGSRTRVVTLARETTANARQYFAGEAEVPQKAITVGIATILEARRIVLLASGAGKAEAVKKALQGPVSESLPASVLQHHRDVTVILDKAAAPEALNL
jgi:glucosamine-6-phosphate deaminase